jgi:hypothetical protein
VRMGIGTGSAYSAAKFCGNTSGVPGIGETEGEFKAEITRLLGPLARLVGLGLGFRFGFRVGGDSVGMVNPHLGKKQEVNPTADASGRSKSRILLLRVLALSVIVVVGGGTRIPGM